MEVVILDTGINSQHKWLCDSIVGGCSIFDNQNKFEDDNGHGSLCASVIKKEDPNVKFWVIKVLDENNCTSLPKLERALEMLIDIPIRLIHMSLSVLNVGDICKLHEICKILEKQGKIMVCSLMNGMQESFPACFPEVLGVQGFILESSQTFWFCPKKKISCIADSNSYLHAELEQRYSLFGKNNSFAAAKMTGIISSILEKDPDLSNKELQAYLSKLAERTFWDKFDLNRSKRFPIHVQEQTISKSVRQKTEKIIREYLEISSGVNLRNEILFRDYVGLTEKNCFFLLKELEKQFKFHIDDYTKVSRYDFCYMSNLSALVERMIAYEI